MLVGVCLELIIIYSHAKGFARQRFRWKRLYSSGFPERIL